MEALPPPSVIKQEDCETCRLRAEAELNRAIVRDERAWFNPFGVLPPTEAERMEAERLALK